MVIFGPWGSETPEPIHLKFDMFDYVCRLTPHAKYGGRGEWGEGLAYLFIYLFNPQLDTIQIRT